MKTPHVLVSSFVGCPPPGREVACCILLAPGQLVIFSGYIKIQLLIFCIMVFILHKTDIYRQSNGHLKFAPLVDSRDVGTLL